MTAKTVTAFYDFDVSPIAFDFAVFATLAEMEREKRDADVIHFVFVPGANDGFRADDISYDRDNKEWRLRNIILPICGMLPCSTEVTICRSREHATEIENQISEPTFPEDYRVEAPVGQFNWSTLSSASARGEKIPSFQASVQASTYMKDWLRVRAGERKPVCITLRESSHSTARNSNVNAWLEFARGLDSAEYAPIIVRDTEKIFEMPDKQFEDFTQCPIAAVNLDLRLALYEQSWLCMMVLNGPGELCRLSNKIRYIFFDMLTEEVPGTTKLYAAAQGFKVGGNIPSATKYQWQIWEPDELEVLQREFARMADLIGDEKQPEALSPDVRNQEDPMDLAVRLQMTGRLEDATSIYQKIVQDDPENADAWHLLGIIAHQAGRTDIAEKLVLRALAIKDEQANYYVTISHILRDLDRPDEAVNALRRAIASDPNDASAQGDLAEALNNQGEKQQAEDVMMTALNLSPNSINLLERAAVLLQEWGNETKAASFFRRAHDIRKDLERRQMEGDGKMSEIPRVMLTTGESN